FAVPCVHVQGFVFECCVLQPVGEGDLGDEHGEQRQQTGRPRADRGHGEPFPPRPPCPPHLSRRRGRRLRVDRRVVAGVRRGGGHLVWSTFMMSMRWSPVPKVATTVECLIAALTVGRLLGSCRMIEEETT